MFLLKSIVKIIFRLCYQAFIRTTHRVEQEQRHALARILERNCNTEYGQKYRFLELKESAELFRQTVPIVGDDIKPLLKEVYEGNYNKLMEKPPFSFSITSGTTGIPKYVPNSSKPLPGPVIDIFAYNHSVLDRFPYLKKEPMQFMADDSPPKLSPQGIPVGFGSGRQYRISPMSKLAGCVIPPWVLSIQDMYDKPYLMGYYLAGTNTACMTCMSCKGIVTMARVLAERAELLAEDLSQGIITSVSLDDVIPNNAAYNHNPELARAILELKNRNLPEKYFIQTLMSLLLPNLRSIGTWRGGSLSFYIPELLAYFPNVSLFDLPHNSSEGIYNVTIFDGPAGIATSNAGFFEFIPEDQWEQENPHTKFLWEIEEGKFYSMVITTASGIYRNRFGDIIEVTGRFNDAPVFQFVSKESRTCIIPGTNGHIYESTFSQALANLKREYNFLFMRFVVFLDKEHQCFRLILDEEVEEAGLIVISRHLDEEIRRLSPPYDQARTKNVMTEIAIEIVLTRYMDEFEQTHIFADNLSTFQTKPQHLCTNFMHYKNYFQQNTLSERVQSINRFN